MKRIILLLTLFISFGFNSCKAQDYIGWVQQEQSYESIKYGYLYNGYAAMDSRNIAASGWHTPTHNDKMILINFVGIYNSGVLKSIGTLYFNSPNTGATNEYKFNGRAGGYRYEIGTFSSINNEGYHFNISNIGGYGSFFSLYYNDTTIRYTSANDKRRGYSIRLIKDSTILVHGQTGTYIGNDGKAYRTICIGTQEWLADNLAETKFRNGDWIPGFDGGTYTPFTNTAWAALTTAGMCVYNDDLSNK